MIKLIECPRDAMQGWPQIIPVQKKIQYINALVKVGFDTLDFGSFVSPKAIPQMADTTAVLKGLKVTGNTKLLAIVANLRGAEEAVGYDEITYLGFPFSVSATFQQRNTNTTIGQSFQNVEAMLGLCARANKQLVVYISMGFGNPYGDEYNAGIVLDWVDKLVMAGIKIVSLADTVGLATPQQVTSLLNIIIPAYPTIETGVHLHSTTENWKAKVDAAIQAGCKRFDGAIKGIGGCPMAGNYLVGNMDTGLMANYFKGLGMLPNLDLNALEACSNLADEIFV